MLEGTCWNHAAIAPRHVGEWPRLPMVGSGHPVPMGHAFVYMVIQPGMSISHDVARHG